jgi:glyoxylase-like metal-dependent hydrolase (beta-lactamase superfamily II)
MTPQPGRPTAADELTTLVLAPNASPMTLEGTNTYLVADPAHGAAVVIDPGPDDPVHKSAVEAALDGREVAAVLITHHHADHAEAAGWAAAWGAPLRAFDPGLIPGADPLRDGERVVAAGVELTAVHTPGHASDHLCLRVVQSDVVLTGDHVLGRGSSVVFWPDGDMAAYMDSLRRLARAPGRALFPGHGPLVEDPAGKLAEYLAHREARRMEVLAAVEAGAGSAAEVVATVYADVPVLLHPAAERSVKALLALLADEGAVPRDLHPGPGEAGGDPSGIGA